MRTLIVIAAALCANAALAEAELEVRVNRIDMAVTAPEPTDEIAKETEETSGIKAQDYNSSRSNSESVTAPVNGADYNSSRSNKTHSIDTDDDSDSDDMYTDPCRDGVDQDCDAPRAAAPANHNTTRSNRTSN